MNVPLIPLVVATALFMQNMDSTILTTALPTIARDLDVDPLALKLAVTSYLVGVAVFIPASGWIADRIGPRHVFRAALLIFLLASLGCAQSSSLTGFVVFRFIQGIGGALMVPVGRLVIIRTVPKAELIRAFAFLTMPALIGPTLGPPLGGAIVTFADWRWIFYINIPMGVLGIWLATLYMPNERLPAPKLDVTGLLLLAIGLPGVVLGAAMSGRHVAPAIVSTTVFIIGAVGLAAYLGHALAMKAPVLDVRLFRIPSFQAGVAGGFLYRLGASASIFLMPLMLQLSFGLSALQSGLITLAGALGAITAKPLVQPMLRRFGFKPILIVGTIANAALVSCFGWFSAGTWHLVIFTALLFSGVLRSMQFTSMGGMSYADISPKQTGPATGLATVSQEVSNSLGVAIGAILLEVCQSIHGNETPQHADYALAFDIIAVISLCSLPFFLLMPRNTGKSISGHHEPDDDEAATATPSAGAAAPTKRAAE